METEVNEETFCDYEWLGFADSREYLNDSDDDYCFKHFFLCMEGNELNLRIINETFTSFHSQAEGENCWPCKNDNDRKLLKGILLRALGSLYKNKYGCRTANKKMQSIND